jgi:hypothetical protein
MPPEAVKGKDALAPIGLPHGLGQNKDRGSFVFFATREYLSRIEVQIMPNWNPTELAKKEANLIAAIEDKLPDFAKACRAKDTPVVLMHQDAFAADYQEEEYRLLGSSSPAFAGKKSA